jgi:hypothetical protein
LAGSSRYSFCHPGTPGIRSPPRLLARIAGKRFVSAWGSRGRAHPTVAWGPVIAHTRPLRGSQAHLRRVGPEGGRGRCIPVLHKPPGSLLTPLPGNDDPSHWRTSRSKGRRRRR